MDMKRSGNCPVIDLRNVETKDLFGELKRRNMLFCTNMKDVPYLLEVNGCPMFIVNPLKEWVNGKMSLTDELANTRERNKIRKERLP